MKAVQQHRPIDEAAAPLSGRAVRQPFRRSQPARSGTTVAFVPVAKSCAARQPVILSRPLDRVQWPGRTQSPCRA
jgi:hypothetical protein